MENILPHCLTFGVIHDSAYIVIPLVCEFSAKDGFWTSGRASEVNPTHWNFFTSHWDFTLGNVYIRVIVTVRNPFSISLLPREG